MFREYERAIQKFEEWEKDIRPYQEKTERYLKELNLSIDPSFLATAEGTARAENDFYALFFRGMQGIPYFLCYFMKIIQQCSIHIYRD